VKDKPAVTLVIHERISALMKIEFAAEVFWNEPHSFSGENHGFSIKHKLAGTFDDCGAVE
jgi:hypothetical protein